MLTDYQAVPALAAYIDRIGAEQLNFKRFVIKVPHGNYYTERCVIDLTEEGEVSVTNSEYAPTKEEAAAIEGAFAMVRFPKQIPVDGIGDEIKAKIGTNPYWVFTDVNRSKVLMLQERMEFKDGTKAYVPWTFFEDGQWRRMEPADGLPFWKPAKRRPTARVMVHEGAKAAAHCDWLVNDDSPEAARAREEHPWAEELALYEHWGMIGGAMVPYRSNYEELRSMRADEVVYMADNDFRGHSVVQTFSRHYRGKMKAIGLDARWPTGWDLADPWPDRPEFWSQRTGLYKGPTLTEMRRPATWATQQLPNPSGKGRKVTVLTEVFRQEWLHTTDPVLFVHVEYPWQHYSTASFNATLRPFSHVDNLANLMLADDAQKALKFVYDPSKATGVVGKGDESAGSQLNTYAPPTIKPMAGEVALWEEMLEHLVPHEGDRRNLMCWLATLIARPDIRMKYGVLLISEAQGVGKTTLSQRILPRLLGRYNVSAASEMDVTGDYTGWAAHKRLVTIEEIYQGHSWKAYNRLKSIMTDPTMMVNIKHIAQYQLENWVHVLASSNSKVALKMSANDRRWFVPEVTEEKEPRPGFWDELYDWLADDHGLEKIAQWALDWVAEEGNLVLSGAHAPSSATKDEIAFESLSLGLQWVMETGRDLAKQLGKRQMVADRELLKLMNSLVYQDRPAQFPEKPLDVRRVLKEAGWTVVPALSGERPARVRGWSQKTRWLTMDPAGATLETWEEAEAGKWEIVGIEEVLAL